MQSYIQFYQHVTWRVHCLKQNACVSGDLSKRKYRLLEVVVIFPKYLGILHLQKDPLLTYYTLPAPS